MRVFVFFCLSWIFVELVLRSKFKTCEQSGFCSRAFKENLVESRFEFRNLECSNGVISAILKDKIFSAELVFKVFALEQERLRVYVTELEPKFPRFDIFEHAWKNIQSPPSVDFTINTIKLNSSTCRFAFLHTKVTVNFDFLYIEVSDNYGHRLLVINSENALYIEPHRTDESGSVPNESFDGHTDSLPHGHQAVSFDATFYEFDHVYGIPEHADTFKLNTEAGEPYRLFNLDVFEYELFSRMALYGSVPFLMAHSERRSLGLHFLNAAEMWISVTKDSKHQSFLGFGKNGPSNIRTRWVAEAGNIDIVLMLGPTPKAVSIQNSATTGFSVLPPIFALGYHQCRWNYNDQDDINEVSTRLDESRISWDVIWLDIEHTPHRQYFMWDSHKFPTPLEMMANISKTGRKLVTVVDPHIRKNDGYYVYNQAIERDFQTRTARNDTFVGWCWPGDSIYIDFLNPEVRSWYASMFSISHYQGSTIDTHTWVDMNEPSVFNGPEVTVPKDLLHGKWENREVHNLYGFMVIDAVYHGGLIRSDYKLRPFILSRSFFSGSQRYGAVWTGDNLASWEHLAIAIPMLLSLSISGISFVGADVSGFFKDPEPELFLRWYQAASMQPFFRAHAHIETKRREPYSYGDTVTNQVREQIFRRYRYLLYIYTLFHESHTVGIPVMRPLWFEFPEDPRTFDIEDAYMLGSSLLIKPIVQRGVSHVQMYFPKDQNSTKWFSLFNSLFYEPGQQYQIKMPSVLDLPMFQKAGTIIATWERQRRASSKMIDDPITLRVVVNDKDYADGVLYLDDFETFEYVKGQKCQINFVYSNNVLRSTVKGVFSSKIRVERVIIHGSKNNFKSAKVTSHDYLSPLVVLNLSNSAVIRRPHAKITKDFKIELQTA